MDKKWGEGPRIKYIWGRVHSLCSVSSENGTLPRPEGDFQIRNYLSTYFKLLVDLLEIF